MKVCSRLVELDEIFRRRNKHLYILALSITLDRASAEDCVHDALVSVAELQQNIDELEPYLFRVVRNKAVHRIKQIQKDDNSNQIKEYLATRSDSNETERLISQIKQHIECLDGNHQQVLLMKLFSDLTFEEIGRIIESSPNTVASWYRRGLEKLKDKIHENR